MRANHAVSRKKSDHGDALVLANILRTDMAAHRPLPQDTDLVRAITVPLPEARRLGTAAAGQPGPFAPSKLLPGGTGCLPRQAERPIRPHTRLVLALAPTPGRAAKLTITQPQAALRRAGRVRGVAVEAARLKEVVFRGDYVRRPEAVEDAMGLPRSALLLQLDAACRAADQLAVAVEAAFRRAPRRADPLELPRPRRPARCTDPSLDRRCRARFADARALKAYAGSAPVTRASGKKTYVGRRFIKNDRLMATGFLWASAALQGSEGANQHYRRRRSAGDWHTAAQRNLFNRFLGQLYHLSSSSDALRRN